MEELNLNLPYPPFWLDAQEIGIRLSFELISVMSTQFFEGYIDALNKEASNHGFKTCEVHRELDPNHITVTWRKKA